MKFTDDQQSVIDARNTNLLVSAAAGSGKTAVLVERIISRITDEKNPVDIDRLLVVTFTRAAAAEMKERIRSSLEDRAERNDTDENLTRQLNLLGGASIMTIDGFCSSLIRDNFDRIGMDPQFRIADSGELELLREDVVEEVLNSAYDGEDEKFKNFLEAFSVRKDDSDVKEAILALYDFAQSQVEPEEWLEALPEAYDLEGDGQEDDVEDHEDVDAKPTDCLAGEDRCDRKSA